MKYAILLKPNSNIPYFEELKKMCVYEAKIMFAKLSIDISELNVTNIGRAYYLMFSASKELDDIKLRYIPNLSFYYSVFIVTEDGLLKPIEIGEEPYVSEDISIRLKYTGKTNEGFTRLLINTAVFSTDFYKDENMNLLDPVCGKGTTLYEGLVLGYNVYGVEKSKKSIEEMYAYVLRFLKEGKYKHKAHKGKALINGKNIGETIEISIGKTKDEVKKNSGKLLKVLRGDTIDTGKFYKKNSMHVIVGDLPYGVQHMGKNKGQDVRNLDNLLENSIESWSRVLKKGGAIALSWNTYTNKREDLEKILEHNGFMVMNTTEYMNFSHRVSQAINRDIIVGIKK